jgi:hypothetical protein
MSRFDDGYIPKEIIEKLVSFPMQEIRPVRFYTWVRDYVQAARRNGIDDEKIVRWLRAQGKSHQWSRPQIEAALRDNGLIYVKTKSDKPRPIYDLQLVQRLYRAITGSDEWPDTYGYYSTKRTKEELEEKSRVRMLDSVSRLNWYEINRNLDELQNLAMAIDIFIENLSDRKKTIQRQKDLTGA